MDNEYTHTYSISVSSTSVMELLKTFEEYGLIDIRTIMNNETGEVE